LAVAIVVTAVATDFGGLAADARFIVVAVLAAAVARRVSVAIGVAWVVPAGLSLLDADVDGAGTAVAASHHFAPDAAVADVAALGAIAVDAVVTHQIVGYEPAA
jgi:hypothetical protein